MVAQQVPPESCRRRAEGRDAAVLLVSRLETAAAEKKKDDDGRET